jgi:ssDNA-binding Zn-finger/Zn-ribbon topoisomerase 1
VDSEGKRVVRKEVDVACPKCGQPMILRKGRFGPFLSCRRYPDCDGVLNLDRKGLIKPPSAPALKVDVACAKCGSPLVLRRSKRGPWLACSKYPKCRGRLAWNTLDEAKRTALEADLTAHEAKTPTVTIRKVDGTPLEPNFSPVLGAVDPAAGGGPAKEAGVNCPECGKPMVIRAGRRGDFLACSGFPRCRNAMNLNKLDELKSQQASPPQGAEPTQK